MGNILSVFIFGCIVGFVELLNRYPEIKYALLVWQSYLYILLNGVISIGALLLIKHFKGEVLECTTPLEINNVIIAGFGGMMILRSSLFSIKHKGEKVEIGFGSIAQILLDSVEKNMSNKMAALRIEKIERLMLKIDFEKAKGGLSTLCVSLIDNFSKEDSDALNNEITKLANMADISNKNKSMQLGRYISKYCDDQLLEKAIKSLGKEIEIPEDANDDKTIDSWIKNLNKEKQNG